MDELKILFLWGFGPLGIVVSGVFLWNLWLAPFKSLEKKISDLEHPGSSTEAGEPTLEQADLRKWKPVLALQVWQTADLCAGLSPKNSGSRKTDAARAAYEQLSQAVKHGEIKVDRSEEDKHISFKIVERSELKRYFQDLGKVPEFLQ